MTDWNQEAENLGGSFWKPNSGTHKVKFLDNGTDTIYTNPKGNETPQKEFKIETDGEEKIWTVTKAKTVNSLWGQIVLVGRYHGTLENKEITLLVKYDEANNKREYTIQEALPLMNQWEKKKEPEKGSAPSLLDEAFGNGR